MMFAIEPPAGNTRGPVHTESLLRTLHPMIDRQSPVSLFLTGSQEGVGLAAECPGHLRVPFVQELQDAYPGTTVSVTGLRQNDEAFREWSTSLRLNPDVLFLRTYEEFRDETDVRQFADPVAGVLSAIRTGQSGRVRCRVELSLRAASPRRVRQCERVLRILPRTFAWHVARDWYLKNATAASVFRRCFASLLARCMSVKGVDQAEARMKATEPLFECWLVVTVRAPVNASQIAMNKLREVAGAYGRFNLGEARFARCRSSRRIRRRRGFLLSAREVASLWHPIVQMAQGVSRIRTSEFTEVEPPVSLFSRQTHSSQTMLGRVLFRQQRSQFGIELDDLRRHMIAVGKTGCGKSTFLLNVVRQQVESNRGVILIDPHGQLAEEVLEVIPKHRTNDVVYFDASDRRTPVGFNPMICPSTADSTLIADGVLTSFKNVFGFDDGSAPRLLHIFRNCLLSLIGTPNASFVNVQRLLVDANFRKSMVAQVRNDAVREFWLTEFNRWNERDRTQYIASLQNKLGAFTTNERLQMILNADLKGIQLRQIMDHSKIMICNLSKGTVGHDASKLLGSLLLSSLQLAAMSRADVDEIDRPDCVVVVDEFHSYLSEGNTTMADALAESRKYRTSYVLSAQMLEQLDPTTLAGVLGNCGSTLCMTVGPRDAETLAGLLGNELTPEDLMRIPKYHAYLRMLLNGAPHTFSMTTLPSGRRTSGRAELIKRNSQQRYGAKTRI